MSASGNDFIVIDNRGGKVNERFQDLSEFAKRYAGCTILSAPMA